MIRDATPSPLRLAFVGCGYVGERLVRQAKTLAVDVLATTRRPEKATVLTGLGATTHVLDPVRGDLSGVVRGQHALVSSIPPGEDGDPTSSVLTSAALARVPVFIYLGSTAVYPAQAGHVDEDTPPQPDGRGRARWQAEEAVRTGAHAFGLRAGILRIAAIYGPTRGIHVRLRAGSFRVPGDGGNHVSRIHVDDLGHIIVTLARVLRADPPGTVRTYCVADESPTTLREHVDGVADHLGLPRPPSIPVDQAPETLRGDRRVSSARLRRELGIQLRYPTWREGLAHCLAEEGRGG